MSESALDTYFLFCSNTEPQRIEATDVNVDSEKVVFFLANDKQKTVTIADFEFVAVRKSIADGETTYVYDSREEVIVPSPRNPNAR